MASGPAPAFPAATVVMLRDGAIAGSDSIEVLLVCRSARAAFAPGAYVFPGGVVDRDDAAAPLVARCRGLTAREAEVRLDLAGTDPPAIAYYVAALREAFEETGILPARTSPPHRTEVSTQSARQARAALLEGSCGFADVLDQLGCGLDLGSLEYIAHWITPLASPRRYDTRFFLAEIAGEADPAPDTRETTSALWIAPEEALRRADRGELVLMRPTAHTLRSLVPHRSVDAARRGLTGRPVVTILPDSPSERNALPTRAERTD